MSITSWAIGCRAYEAGLIRALTLCRDVLCGLDNSIEVGQLYLIYDILSTLPGTVHCWQNHVEDMRHSHERNLIWHGSALILLDGAKEAEPCLKLGLGI